MSSYWDEKEKDYRKNQEKERKNDAKLIRQKPDDQLVDTIQEAATYLYRLRDMPMSADDHEYRDALRERLKALSIQTVKGEG